MKRKKFYRSIIQVEVLSDRPLPKTIYLKDLEYEISEGDMVGKVTTSELNKQVSGKVMVKLLEDAGSSNDFFGLDEEGTQIR